jgi:hypothetical protein
MARRANVYLYEYTIVAERAHYSPPPS